MLNWTSCCLNCVELDLLVLLDHYSPCCGICGNSLTIFLSSTSVNETLNILLTKPVYSGVSTWRGSPSVPEYGKAVSYHHWHGETQDKNAAYNQLTTISCLLVFDPPQSPATGEGLILASVVLGASRYAELCGQPVCDLRVESQDCWHTDLRANEFPEGSVQSPSTS